MARTHRTTYLCDQCGLTAEDYMDGLPLRWVQVTRNVPCKPSVHFCSWPCLAAYFNSHMIVQPKLTEHGHS